ncbi:ABC transporter permease [Metallumcola ferriviriculae]|uniref:ABC transporter permease n=1 Tax=Metallumcola ferriviriculae TaxID=3039180 RepID=A0AAU0UKB1_9FIRM|nr:ABC transporter permease [Desulfitibacteraceae bacterium MK1]
MNRQRLASVVRKEILQIRRDPASLGIVIVMPLLMLFLFGYAVTTDVDHINTVVVDMDRTPDSRRLIADFQHSGYFDVVTATSNSNEVDRLLDGGTVKVGIIIPAGYMTELRRGQSAQVQAVIDGSDPTVARTALNSVRLLAQRESLQLKVEAARAKGDGIPLVAVDMRPRVRYNPDLDSVRFNIPGLIGLIMQNITVMLTAFAMVRERERGTMEQLMVTPVRPGELILGKLIPYVFIGFFDIILVLAAGVFWFKVPVAGSVTLLLALSAVFLLTALGLGLFISTIARTQLQAMQMTVLVILPSVLLSGFVFPREAMPLPINWLGYVIPLTYFLTILRGIILKGVGAAYLWPQVLTLACIGTAILAIAIIRFQKKLD